ncbi:hypothetical protein [Bacillus sp. V59.32b]|uniref:hypothetical protein n=1 Tax=Bacillus sp. V59.32b TaxID=1758642 RepID=UPI000E3CF851|nr:hypothetical protein [Bacillus sp. V59.32b]RFU60674.1 hypothetical protein D0463_16355 [Bacillus sp. V59.32b]
MLETNYEEMIVILKEKGEVEIPLTDCDMQFYIEDTLESLDLKYQKLIPPVRRGSVKKMIIKIEY